MNEKDVINSIGRCGRVCAFCHEAAYCDGCKSKEAACSRHNDRDGCYQYQCSLKKRIEGCWECDEAPCDEDVFSSENNIRYRAFVRFAKYEGVEELGKCVFMNQIRGIPYSGNKGYDKFNSEEDVVRVLTKHYLVKD